MFFVLIYMLWVQYCVHSSFLYILPPSSQTFLRNRSPGFQQQQQKYLKSIHSTQQKVWSLKKYFRSILNVLSFAEFISDVCGLAFFFLSFCFLFAFSSCFMLYFYFWLFLFLPWKIFWTFTPWLFLFYCTGIFQSTNDNNKCLILWFCIYSLQAAKPEICDVLWNRPDYILHFTFVQYIWPPVKVIRRPVNTGRIDDEVLLCTIHSGLSLPHKRM